MSINASTNAEPAPAIDSALLVPNKSDISSHLYALFDPAFVQAHPDAWIEIAYAKPDGKLNAAENFSAFDLEKAAAFAEAKNKAGYNIYVGAALRHGDKPASGRANDDHVLAASHSWADYDHAGDDERINAVLKAHQLTPAMVVTTGNIPHPRRHLYFRFDGTVTPKELEAVNASLRTLLGSDKVQNPDRIMRLAGTVNHPSPKKVGRGYVAELTALHINKDACAYSADELIKLAPASGATSGDPYVDYADANRPGRTNADLIALLKASRVKDWHNNMREAVATMIGRSMSDRDIKVACAAYCEGELQDADLRVLIDTGRKRFNKPNIELPVEGSKANENDIDRLNKKHAVLPIGGKTRVVTFGELPAFPGRETIVMTQTIDDFKLLHNKHRHTYKDKEGEEKHVPMGSHWIGSAKRRQYDDGMAFMPQKDGDVGNKLNLWRGFGVKQIKGAPGSRAEAGCQKFLDFMCDIICSGNEEHFDYLLKREATILQKKIRSEIAVGLRTTEEGCGKGFYEFVMRHLLGNHAMQITNPEHIVGKFNPHLEVLLRVTADEALFVGNPKHRNALFSLITEADMPIEPKNCGIYQADNFLNISITSNSDHFLPVSDSARRFFIPTVSTARKQDVVYFSDLKDDLEAGGYEALLYHLLQEVVLTGFNVRKVPQTAGLREQRDQSLESLDTWWVELLETGVLTGSDPLHPNKAVSGAYDRVVDIGTPMNPMRRYVKQLGLYDQARAIVPKLKQASDNVLAAHLTKMGCDNTKRVLRNRGWTFPPLAECRAAWVKRFPDWKWRDPDITEWQAEEDDDEIEALRAGPTLVGDTPRF